ncbi:uncharacterized protein [Littorina saxatilis]|uniref:uncharacterized protein n=1 Tax=Littorina saxatilis TaxID=31220 RepID=UPI0038B4B19D
MACMISHVYPDRLITRTDFPRRSGGQPITEGNTSDWVVLGLSSKYAICDRVQFRQRTSANVWTYSALFEKPPFGKAECVNVSIDHCQACSLEPPDVITCPRELRHLHESLSYVINYVMPDLCDKLGRFVRMDAHSAGVEEVNPPSDMSSAYQQLASASLDLKVTETVLENVRVLEVGGRYSNSLLGPLFYLRNILCVRQCPITLDMCRQSKEVRRRGLTGSVHLAVRSAKKAIRTLQRVYDHVSSSVSTQLYCDLE